ncbi:hypothetical protein [Vibrio phage pTD1]|uniref:Uncharacterized protein n=1 Tax=Vibrio phage pTD1 TaxID=1938577 RepID=A0A1Q2U2Q9_9CAUD|nr:hypothetical protein FDH33_gp040 [Vibrio phage pTD1]BAW98249.1 hypothetical protein [Vibrio phage pTD1]
MTESKYSIVSLLETGGSQKQSRGYLDLIYKLGYDIDLDCVHSEVDFTYGRDSECIHHGKLIRAYETGWVKTGELPEAPFEEVIDELLSVITKPTLVVTDVPEEHGESFKEIFKSLMTSLRDHQANLINGSIRSDLYNWHKQYCAFKIIN